MPRIFVLIFGLATCVGCASDTASLSGVVRSGDGVPISKALIQLMGSVHQTESDSHGYFELDFIVLKHRTYLTLKVTKERHQDNYYAIEDRNHIEVEMADSKLLAKEILDDSRLQTIRSMALELLGSSNVTAGGEYHEVWIRDLNTFVETFLESGESAVQRSAIRSTLLKFYQGQDTPYDSDDGEPEFAQGSIADHYDGDTFKKISVETDQETSLIQATSRYIQKTSDHGFLDEVVNGLSVRQRITNAFEFLFRDRQDPTTGLIFGGTTVDWGDVSTDVNDGIGANLRKGESHIAIDIYDNAMLLLALKDYLEVLPKDAPDRPRWESLITAHRGRVKDYLWDAQLAKFRPHLYPDNDLGYLTGSPWLELDPHPFVDGTPFDETKMYFHGGTGIAILANLLSKDQIAWSVQLMRNNVSLSSAQSIGLTVYPPYPQNVWTSLYTIFRNGLKPYYYQNGGDWTWFGARIVLGLVNEGFVREAYDELIPMLDRVIEHDGFYEWWHPNSQGGMPVGDGDFRGSAGVLFTAIDALQKWAQSQLVN